MKFIETWKTIAAHIGRSERWCRYMADRAEDPLPVFKFGGMTRLDLDALEAGAERQKQRRPGRDVAAAIGAGS